jgi:hypothetical protein
MDGQTEKKSLWQRVGKNLHRYVPSGIYFAKIRAGGKLTVKSLETDVRSIANFRLADLEKNLRQMVERHWGTLGQSGKIPKPNRNEGKTANPSNF